MKFLRTNNEMGDTRCNDIMKGYRFEYMFLRHTGELCLTCTEVGGTPTCYTFKGLIYQHTVEGEALNSIGINSLVHLRDSHPVIDAVAKLKDQNNNQWLLLVQVSLCVDNDDGVTKVFNSSLTGTVHTFAHSS